VKVLTALGFALAALLAVPALLWLLQDRMLYFPAPATVAELARGPLHPWPSEADFRGLVAAPAGAATATAIVFHGNAGHAGHRDYYARALAPLGLRVILAEYPGYGPRSGKPGEDALVSDAVETIERARREFGPPLLLVGESLGAAVAGAAGARRPDLVAGLLLITPWDSLARVGAHHYPWLPVAWLLRDRYDTVQRLAGFDRPVVVAIAAQDSIVPARFGRALYTGIGGPKTLRVIEGADHNDWPDRVDQRWWHDAVDAALGRSR
jgi:pimeloyl-ACP methyl ester carboxylesterase